MAQPVREPGPWFLRPVVLQADVEVTVDRGVVTRGEAQGVLARLAIVVDQAVQR